MTLGIIVLVRTFLSFSLEIELDGVVPWRRRAVGVAETGEAPASSRGDTAARLRPAPQSRSTAGAGGSPDSASECAPILTPVAGVPRAMV